MEALRTVVPNLSCAEIDAAVRGRVQNVSRNWQRREGGPGGEARREKSVYFDISRPTVRLSSRPGWRNWQTHGTQNPAPFKGVSVRPRLRAPVFAPAAAGRRLPRRSPRFAGEGGQRPRQELRLGAASLRRAYGWRASPKPALFNGSDQCFSQNSRRRLRAVLSRQSAAMAEGLAEAGITPSIGSPLGITSAVLRAYTIATSTGLARRQTSRCGSAITTPGDPDTRRGTGRGTLPAISDSPRAKKPWTSGGIPRAAQERLF